MILWRQRYCFWALCTLVFSPCPGLAKQTNYSELPREINPEHVPDRVMQVLREQHRIFHERNIKRVVESEMGRKFSAPGEQRRCQYSPQGEIVLPICDYERPPFDWRFIDLDEAKYHLAYRGHRQDGVHFLSWGEGNWIRLSGDVKERDYEGMDCEFTWDKIANRHNYVQVALNQNILATVKQKQKVLPIFQHTVLQMSGRAEELPTKVTGRVALSSAPGLDSERLRLQLWEKKNGEWQLLTSATGPIGDGYQEITWWTVEATVSAGSEVRMAIKVDQKGREEILRSQALGRLYIYAADLSLTP